MAQHNAGATLVAASIIGASIIAGSLLVRFSLDRVVAGLGALQGTIETAAGPEPARDRQAERPSRPDPRRRYTVATQDAPVRGDPDAKLAIVAFSDFECPFCSRVNPTLLQILDEYEGKVRLVFKHLPLRIHPRAPAAHAAAEAAHRQGKFWEMHDKIFADQRRMSPERYREYARELGLDLERFDRDVESTEVTDRIDAEVAEASRLGVGGTPSFFINGRFLSGAVPADSFRALIDEELGTG